MQNHKQKDSAYDSLNTTYNPKPARGNYGVFSEDKKGVGYQTSEPNSGNYQTSGNLEKEEELQFPEELLLRKV